MKRAIEQRREERDIKKSEAIRARMGALDEEKGRHVDDVAHRLLQLRASMQQLPT